LKDRATVTKKRTMLNLFSDDDSKPSPLIPPTVKNGYIIQNTITAAEVDKPGPGHSRVNSEYSSIADPLSDSFNGGESWGSKDANVANDEEASSPGAGAMNPFAKKSANPFRSPHNDDAVQEEISRGIVAPASRNPFASRSTNPFRSNKHKPPAIDVTGDDGS
jgi:hypothetical protein